MRALPVFEKNRWNIDYATILRSLLTASSGAHPQTQRLILLDYDGPLAQIEFHNLSQKKLQWRTTLRPQRCTAPSALAACSGRLGSEILTKTPNKEVAISSDPKALSTPPCLLPRFCPSLVPASAPCMLSLPYLVDTVVKCAVARCTDV